MTHLIESHSKIYQKKCQPIQENLLPLCQNFDNQETTGLMVSNEPTTLPKNYTDALSDDEGFFVKPHYQLYEYTPMLKISHNNISRKTKEHQNLDKFSSNKRLQLFIQVISVFFKRPLHG